MTMMCICSLFVYSGCSGKTSVAIETDPSLPSGGDLIPLDDIWPSHDQNVCSNSAHNVQSSADSDSLIPGYLLVSCIII